MQSHPRSRSNMAAAQAAARVLASKPTTPSRLTPEQLAQFCEHLSLTGNMPESARLVGTTAREVRARVRIDQEFADAVKEAWDDFRDEVLIPAARRRAVDGVERGVYYRGEPARNDDGTPALIREFSDALLIRLLEVHDPRFRPHQVQEIRAAVGPADIDDLSPEARAKLEAFLDQRARDREQDPPPALPPPPGAPSSGE